MEGEKVKMSEVEKRILSDLKLILEVLDRINKSQEEWIKED